MASFTNLGESVIILFALYGVYGEINASRDGGRRTTASEKQAELLNLLDDYDIVHPYVTDEVGIHVTSDLREIHTPRRHRRELPSRGEDELPVMLYMAVNVSRKERLRLNLTHRADFLAEGFVIERRRGRNISLAEVTRPTKLHRCQYRGHLVNDTNSKVALSVCSGLRGMIWSDGEEYFIEPVVGHVTKSSRKHPHVIYRRSAIPGDDVTPMYADAKRIVDEGLKYRSEEACGVNGDHADYKRETVGEGEGEGHQRSKRSISHERFVETLVVVDHNMYDYYHDLDVETYTLTIMNMVTALYHDASLGNLVNIVLVRLMILEEPVEGLDISHHADNSLNSFCSWQQDINAAYGGGDEHENHHDTALLLTRKDICQRLDEPCATLGLAYIYGMCQAHRTCSINEDSGLGLAYTVAHEMGHLFGIQHDGLRYNNDCQHPAPGTSQLMAAQMNGHRGPMKWSRCSKAYITRFLDRGWGDCLLDEPSPRHSSSFNFPKLPAGMMYNADYQCKLLFKRNATLCGQDNVQMSTMCTTLWCQVDNYCNSKTIPAAPGTSCGENKRCYDGKCVHNFQPSPPIPGDWGEWSEWTECSRTCGGGVMIQERHCNNPAPANGGMYCQGKRKNYALCNLQPCPEGSVGFREQQCTYYNTIPYQNLYLEWLPVIEPGNECTLRCQPMYYRFSVVKAPMVGDGTTCGKELKDICINGICYKVGCDQRIGSSAVEDICGVCHGDGSSCKQISEEFNNTVVPGPVKITVIPAHARSIRVEEKYDSVSYMELQEIDGRTIFNSYRHGFNVDGEYAIDNGIISGIYVRQGSMEKLTIKGPLPEPINIVCDIQTRYPSIGYGYYLPKLENETSSIPEKFVWQFDEWTPCSTTCGNGTQRSVVRCVRFQPFSYVEDAYCNETKPDDKQQTCNEHSCPASWWIGPWQPCSTSCGEGIRRRSVFCIKSISPDEQILISEAACIEHGAEAKPAVSGDCINYVCPSEADWDVGNWSECSSTCGEGTQHRNAECIRPDGRCELEHRPQTERSCEVPCPHEYSSYDNNLPPNAYSTDYSYSYGDGQVNTFGGWESRENQLSKESRKHRNYNERGLNARSGHAKVDSDALMNEEFRNDEERRNFVGGRRAFLDSSTATLKEWITGDWSQCSVTCGPGTRTRTVLCVIADTTTTAIGCYDHNRPSSAEICHREACPMETGGCRDTLDTSLCRMAKQSGTCSLPAFKEACCETCGGR